MNSSPPSIPDAIGFGVFLASFVYAPSVAAVIGPYLMIVLASVVGASFATKRREKTTRLGALFYFLRVAALAVLGTVSIASIASSYNDNITERVLITPVALAIGAIGDDWPALIRYFIGKFFGAVDFFRGGRGGTP